MTAVDDRIDDLLPHIPPATVHRRIKHALDPQYILNPGAVI